MCLALAAVAARTVRAELAYGAGLAPHADPVRDVPGRLDAYEEAADLGPGNPLYALRAGQIRLMRAGRSREARTTELAAAEAWFRRAVALHPVEARARAGLAQVLLARGEPDAAARESARSFRLAPRSPGVIGRSGAMFVLEWRRTRDPAALRGALRCAEAGERIRETSIPRGIAKLLAQEPVPNVAAFLEAVGGESSLLRTAAALIAPARPADAEMLAAAAARRP